MEASQILFLSLSTASSDPPLYGLGNGENPPSFGLGVQGKSKLRATNTIPLNRWTEDYSKAAVSNCRFS